MTLLKFFRCMIFISIAFICLSIFSNASSKFSYSFLLNLDRVSKCFHLTSLKYLRIKFPMTLKLCVINLSELKKVFDFKNSTSKLFRMEVNFIIFTFTYFLKNNYFAFSMLIFIDTPSHGRI